MSGLLFVLALASLPVLALPLSRRLCPGLTLPASVGVAGAMGATLLCVAMFLLSWLGVRWSVGVLVAPFLVLAFLARTPPPLPPRADGVAAAPGIAVGVVVLLLGLVTYAVVTARASAPDLLLFWGPKGQRFAQSGSIDIGFLRDPFHIFMHPDYPPMLTCLFAWAVLVAGRFAWGAAMLTLSLFLALALLTFYGFAAPSLGRRTAAEYTALLAALLGFVMIQTLTAGNAEPLLLYFEVVALSALVFAGDRAEGLITASVGLTAAALTKVEGLPFAAIAVVAFLVLGPRTRRLRSAALLGLPPVAAFGAWLVFCRLNGLVDVYRPGERTTLTFRYLPILFSRLAHESLYGAGGLPWIAPVVLLALGIRSRRVWMPATCAFGFLTFIVYLYLTSRTDPSLWIGWSAGRLLLTPLMCLIVAAAAAGGDG